MAGSGISPESSIFTGSFTYNTTTPATFIGADFANYFTGNISLIIDGAINYSGATTEIQINNNSFFNDRFSSIIQTPSLFDTPPGDRANNVQFELLDNTDTAFSSITLPNSLNLSDFTSARVDIRSFNLDGKNYFITGSVDTLIETSNVPIPAAVGLFGAGLISLIGMARRRKI